jgi:hypothetical protein
LASEQLASEQLASVIACNARFRLAAKLLQLLQLRH